MKDVLQQNAISARYLVTYDWPVAADTQDILARVKGVAEELGNVALPVMAETNGKKKPIAADLLKIEDRSTVRGVETIDGQGAADGLAGLFYSYSEQRDMAVLSIAIPTHQLKPGSTEGIIRTLHKANGIGYTIAFDAVLGKKALYYAIGISFGEIKTHYDQMLARELGRFFFQRTRTNRSDRSYNRDKIRNVYPVNVLNRLQRQGMQSTTGLGDDRFTRLDDDRYLLVLDDAEVAGIRENLVGSDFVI